MKRLLSNVEANDALTFGGLAIAVVGVGFAFSPAIAAIVAGTSLVLIGLFAR